MASTGGDNDVDRWRQGRLLDATISGPREFLTILKSAITTEIGPKERERLKMLQELSNEVAKAEDVDKWESILSKRRIVTELLRLGGPQTEQKLAIQELVFEMSAEKDEEPDLQLIEGRLASFDLFIDSLGKDVERLDSNR
eukprot:GHVU01077952.1.p3 GENE.GHVU01077952.1~~GHVU01077952.1.p3  ORF type:complete len:141 (-),score=18.67 GHVU01077952.1:1179-1601(-)